jgi:hypothetical protein
VLKPRHISIVNDRLQEGHYILKWTLRFKFSYDWYAVLYCVLLQPSTVWSDASINKKVSWNYVSYQLNLISHSFILLWTLCVGLSKCLFILWNICSKQRVVEAQQSAVTRQGPLIDNRGIMFPAQSVSMAAHTTMVYFVSLLNNDKWRRNKLRRLCVL